MTHQQSPNDTQLLNSKEDSMNNDLICTEQAAIEFNFSMIWLMRQRQKGTGPDYMCINGHIVYSRRYLKAWLLERNMIAETRGQGD